MEVVQHTLTLANPLFSHLPYAIEDGKTVRSGSDSVDIIGSLKSSSAFDEAYAIFTEEIAKKIALLIGVSVDEINMDSSIAAFGLDSLIAMESKNWTARTFQAAMQTAEIFRSPNIVNLAMLVTSRSTVVPEQF